MFSLDSATTIASLFFTYRVSHTVAKTEMQKKATKASYTIGSLERKIFIQRLTESLDLCFPQFPFSNTPTHSNGVTFHNYASCSTSF